MEKLQFSSCIAVGDILNQKRNSLVIVTADGWCYIYNSPYNKKDAMGSEDTEEDKVDGQVFSGESTETQSGESSNNSSKLLLEDKNTNHLVCIHIQRIPANAKNILLADVDGDDLVEMILGLTDRVVRSYRWSSSSQKNVCHFTDVNTSVDSSEVSLGKLVALNKWECANQIGSISLHHSWDGQPFLLIAQPGGTFMRIKCQTDDILCHGMENLELSCSSSSPSESIYSPSIDYQTLGLSRMRNQNISTEILGDFRTNHDKNSNDSSAGSINAILNSKAGPYAVATLDGTIMWVQDEVILWAIAVDHQIFALTKLDITGNGSDDIVVCSWDGQTYILDQQKNCVRFHLEESVQAFESGYYHLGDNEPSVTCLVYVTFKNTIVLYYDVSLKDMICKQFEPELCLLTKLLISNGKTAEEAVEVTQKLDKNTKKSLVNYLLYNVKS